MKTLHLLRHAKSSWNDPSLEDIDRPLNQRGKRACKVMGPIIEQQLDQHTVIACSTATRAQQTCDRVTKNFATQFTVNMEDSLYTFSSSNLLNYLCALDDEIQSIMLIGHNPALTDLTNILSVEPIDNIPTCGYIKTQLPIDKWSALNSSEGELVAFIKPKDISESC